MSRIDATQERLERARESSQGAKKDAAGRIYRFADPFDTMRNNRLLAPHDPRLNDVRWLIGESLRRTHARARLDQLYAVDLARGAGAEFVPGTGLPKSEIALQARDKMREAEKIVGLHAWPIVRRIVLEGDGVRDCRGLVPEPQTPWRADAVIVDRLRVALDRLGELVGVTPKK